MPDPTHGPATPPADGLPEGSREALERLQERIGYRFRDPALLCQSLRHPSYCFERREVGDDYQRLEFLGDALLSAFLAEDLFHRQPGEREGALSRHRALLSNGPQLAALARELGLSEGLFLSPGEEATGGRHKSSILEDACEALVGAIYLDSDWPTARKVVLAWYGDPEERLNRTRQEENPKGRLQELVQPVLGNNALEYRLEQAAGPDHRRVFQVTVHIGGRDYGAGSGPSKKEAEEHAARAALRRWAEEGPAAAVGSAGAEGTDPGNGAGGTR